MSEIKTLPPSAEEKGRQRKVLTDLFGRTIEEIERDIRFKKILQPIKDSWRGNDTLSAEIKSARLQIELDERQLAFLKAGRDPKLPRSYSHIEDRTVAPLSGNKLDKWREDLKRGFK